MQSYPDYYVYLCVRDSRGFISDYATNDGMSTRRRPTRRTVLRTIGSLGLASIAAAGTASADASDGDETAPSTDSPRSTATGCEPTQTQQYLATVDRIVDGRHVVLLLEADGELVGQHVTPRRRLEAVEEGDVLLVVLGAGDVLAAVQLPKRPDRGATEPTPQERFDELAADDPT